MAVGNYGGRISPLPMRKLNFKCSVAAAWTMLLTSVFAMNWVDFFLLVHIVSQDIAMPCSKWGGKGRNGREASFLAHVRLVSD